jgi:hypothetical protein
MRKTPIEGRMSIDEWRMVDVAALIDLTKKAMVN